MQRLAVARTISLSEATQLPNTGDCCAASDRSLDPDLFPMTGLKLPSIAFHPDLRDEIYAYRLVLAVVNEPDTLRMAPLTH